MFAHRIVIPDCLRKKVLQTLHKAHPGMDRMKRLARSFVYWPNLDKDIESLVRNCSNCQAAAKNPTKAHLESWPIATAPWTRVHIDYAGPIDGIYFLVVVDAYSKWSEIVATSSITSTATINLLMKIFAQFGNPETLVSDNGTQFSSSSFDNFCKSRGITHLHSPPFHPQSNGQAERFVDTFKRALVKLKGEEDTTTAIQTFLQAYRSTSSASSPDNKSPAENFIGRKIRTVLDLLMPSVNTQSSRHRHDMESQFNAHHGTKDRRFAAKSAVFVKDYRQSKPTWTPGIVIRRTGTVTYLVKCNGLVWTRHANQLLRRDHHRHQADSLLDIFKLPSLPLLVDQQPHAVNQPLLRSSPIAIADRAECCIQQCYYNAADSPFISHAQTNDTVGYGAVEEILL
ncbi:unnamed protein product [Caenorhabditis sp. 36 PRJEB53466]|nr:unnamed protein product [Caenorhabditis sp. 36 PRJEB53466]